MTARIEDTNVKLARAAGWSWPDIYWERWQARAKRHQIGHQEELAARWWKRAFLLAWALLPGLDPRWAISMVNLGAACQVRGKLERGQWYHQLGIERWADISAWLDELPTTPTARSSSHHLRLGQEHSETYRQNQRVQLLRHFGELADNIQELELEPPGESCGWVIGRPPVYDTGRKMASALFLCAYAVPRDSGGD